MVRRQKHANRPTDGSVEKGGGLLTFACKTTGRNTLDKRKKRKKKEKEKRTDSKELQRTNRCTIAAKFRLIYSTIIIK
jgi:hypothetical protein